jgi:hypothetical protein
METDIKLYHNIGDIVSEKMSDYVFHPPSGSSLPGCETANQYDYMPPDELRSLLSTIKDSEELKKIKSSLKKWERIWQEGNPYKKTVNALRKLAHILLKAENNPAPQNLDFYYQDYEVPEGFESCLDGLENLHDNDDMTRFDYNRQGERPLVDMDFLNGDFLSPKDRVFEKGVVTPKGDGANPEGLEYPDPPTGGPIDALPDMI